jgi:hypothetical protein
VLRPPIESARFTSIRYTERLTEIGARHSIGTIGDSYDNALVLGAPRGQHHRSNANPDLTHFTGRFRSPSQTSAALFTDDEPGSHQRAT